MLNEQILLIAEIGGNHEGSVTKAYELADAAMDAGATVLKYQLYSGETLVSSEESPDRVAHFNKFALDVQDYISLANYIESKGCHFNASIWQPDLLEIFDRYMGFYKIGSGDLTAYPIIKEIVKFKKPIILSTGLSTLKEVKDTVGFIRSLDKNYKKKGMLAVLQCTSMYPIPDCDANLSVISSFKAELQDVVVGYSDHTVGTDAAKMAIAMGAKIIEVHFTDSRDGKDFRDHQVSFEPKEFSELLRWTVSYERLLGNPDKKPMPSEITSGHIESFRRSVYLKRDLKAGTTINSSDLVVLRPNTGIDARLVDTIVGKTLNRDVAAFKRLEIDYFDS